MSDKPILSYADRGKDAEHQVRVVLDQLALRVDTAIYRLPDARSGSKAPTLADFQLIHKGTFFLLEVKQTNAKSTLPYKNFDKDKVARMRRWQMAGAVSQVLIYHKKLDKWRLLPVSFFFKREEGKTSWDVSDAPLVDLLDILSPAKTFTAPLKVPNADNIE